MEMSTTPFAHRKKKKEKYEELPVIRMKPVPAPETSVKIGEAEATKAGIVVPDDATEVLLRLQGKPEKILTPDTVTHAGFMELIRRVPEPLPKPVIYGANPPPREEEASVTVTATKPKITDHIKLGEGDTTLWREAVRPDKKGDKK